MMQKWIWIAMATVALGCGRGDTSKKADPTPCIDCDATAGSSELSIGELSSALIEGGSPVTSVIRLQRQPSAEVKVLIVSLDPSLVTIEPAEMTFDGGTWNAAQLLTITPVDDRVDEPDEQATIEFSLVSEDSGFGGRPVAPLLVTVIDDDEAGSFKIQTSGDFATREDGTPLVLDVTLSTQPGGDVLVPVRVDDDTEASVDVTSLTFGELDWNIPKKITLTGIDDREADGDQTYNLVLGPTNSTEETFNGLPEQFTEITSIDGVCGNGLRDGSEACEPTANETMSCDYGESNCTYCDSSCKQVPGNSAGYCGDGQVQSGFEACDEPTRACPYGQQSCQTCSMCETVAGQPSGYCGDGVVQSGNEECDGSVCCNSSCVVDFANCDLGCLVISEYVEAVGNDKAIELYNCDTAPINTTGMVLCVVTNGASNCSRFLDLNATIAAGDTHTICHSSSTFPQQSCDVLENNVTEFNGDDRFLLFLDLDNNNDIGPSDVIIDAFGETALRPFDVIWASANYSRCNFSAYDGTGAFNLNSYWEDTGACVGACNYPAVYQGLGVPPTETCN